MRRRPNTIDSAIRSNEDSVERPHPLTEDQKRKATLAACAAAENAAEAQEFLSMLGLDDHGRS